MKLKNSGFSLDRGAGRERWVKEYRASGMGLKRFAQRHGLKPGQLHYWVYQSPKPLLEPAAAPTFQELLLPIPALSAGSWTAEISLPNGATVRLARETDATWAISLMNALRRPCSP